MAISAADVEEARILPRALAGATVLQIIASLRDNSEARTAVNIARALVHAGARAIVAAADGPLVGDLKSFGGEWLPFASATVNPLKLRRNADRLEAFLAEARVDIVHAKNAGAAWSALVATDRGAVRLVTDLPDLPHQRMRLAAFYLGGLSRGDRIIARSQFNAAPDDGALSHPAGTAERHPAQHRHGAVQSRGRASRTRRRAAAGLGHSRRGCGSCWRPAGCRRATARSRWCPRRACSPTTA